MRVFLVFVVLMLHYTATTSDARDKKGPRIYVQLIARPPRYYNIKAPVRHFILNDVPKYHKILDYLPYENASYPRLVFFRQGDGQIACESLVGLTRRQCNERLQTVYKLQEMIAAKLANRKSEDYSVKMPNITSSSLDYGKGDDY